MKSRAFLLSLFLITAAASAFAQLPPNKWWRRPEIVTNLGLTEDQQTKLDGIFRSAANDLIDARGEVEKQTIALRGELEQSQLNRGNIQKIAGRLNDARGKLFERELMMMADMRGVLTDQQWARMRAQLDEVRPKPKPGRVPDGQMQPRGPAARRPPGRMPE